MRKNIKNLTVILVCLLVVTLPVTATYPPVVYLNDLPSTASYVIKTDGSVYWSVRSDGYTSASNTNASLIINNAFTSLTTGGSIFLKQGYYDLGTNYISIALVNYMRIRLIGESRNTTIAGNGLKLLDFTNVAWVQGDHWPYLSIEHLSFEHNTLNNASITLDCEYGLTWLDDVAIENTNSSSRQGVGFKIEPYNNPGQIELNQVEILDYAINYMLGADHITASGLNSVRGKNANFYLYNMSYFSMWNPFVLHEFGGDDAYAFYMQQIYCSATIYNMMLEGNSSVAQIDYTNLPNNRVTVEGFRCVLPAGSTYTYIATGSYITLNQRYVTINWGTQWSGNGTALAHSLGGTPEEVYLSWSPATYDSVPMIASYTVNSTYIVFWLYWTNGTCITSSHATITWEAIWNGQP